MTLRRLTCEECYRGCGYRDFRHTVPTTKNFSGSSERPGFGSIRRSQGDKVAEDIEAGRQSGVTRRTILGEMHERKMEEWVRAVDECRYRGEKIPATLHEAADWALSRGNEAFRKDVQGWSDVRWTKAGRFQRKLSLGEFMSWWDSVRQRSLEDLPPSSSDKDWV